MGKAQRLLVLVHGEHHRHALGRAKEATAVVVVPSDETAALRTAPVRVLVVDLDGDHGEELHLPFPAGRLFAPAYSSFKA